MDRHSRRIPQGIHAPYFVVNRFFAEDHVGIDHEKFQYLELLIGQDFFFVTDENAVRVRIERDISQGNTGFFMYLCPFQALILGQLGFDPGHKDAR